MSRFRLLAALCAAATAVPAAPAAAGGWVAPLPRPLTVVRGIDLPPQPWLPGHRGVDLLGRPGQPVRAAAGGVVGFAGQVAGVGVVTVRHPSGLETTYEPLRPQVRRGDRVDAGAVLGRLARAGGHCPPRACLHWGLRRGPDYLDPLGLLGLARVRLLPMPPRPAAPGTAAVPVGALVAGTAIGLHRRRRSRQRNVHIR